MEVEQHTAENEWKEETCTEVYMVDLPGNWDIQEETKEKIWKTVKGDIFKITKKNEAIFIKEVDEDKQEVKRKKIEIKK